MNRYILSLLLVFLSFCGKSQTSKYQIFDNYKLGVESNSVKFFIQDSLGLMWIGTDKGLSHFDGYTTYPHYTIGSKSNTIICCGILLNESHLLLGTERGVLLFNITTDKYEDFLPDFKHDIRSLIKVGDEIWLGCTDGLFIYNQVSGTLTELYQSNPKDLKHKMTYALLEKNGYVYLGSNGQLGRYSINDKVYELLDVSGVGGNYLINSLLDDDKRKCIWIGQGGVLLKYNLKTGELVNKGQFNVVKSMVIDADDNIIMGTDNGLYVYDGVHIKQCIVHDSREPNSLANDIVWSVYEDMMGNIWFGTVNGISIAPVYRRFNTLPISKITDTGEGNQFYSIFYDTKNNYWLGGTNGLIKSPENFNLSSNTHWYKMGGSPYKISHNHIRDIFEDKDQNLFVATDFGLNRYNNQTQEFIRYTITAKDGTLNANWPHAMLEDKQHRMWVASYNGGIFVIEKSKLLTTNSTPMADLHYSMRNGLSGNNVVSIVADKQDNIWALIQNSAINKIESSTGVITKYPIEKYTNGAIPNYLMSDSLGNIWIGYINGVVCINPATNQVKNSVFSGEEAAEILAMCEVDNKIWISTTNGIWIADKTLFTTRHLNSGNHVYTSIYYDKTNREVLLGGIDHIAHISAELTAFPETDQLIISAVYVNNQLYNNSINIRYQDKISLAYNQNNIRVEFSDLSYIKESRAVFAYKLNDNNRWTSIKPGENSLTLNTLTPGMYRLSIGKTSLDEGVITEEKTFSFRIKPPWYGTTMAKVVYLLFVLTLIWWIYFFITAKQRMKNERLEKEKTLEQAKRKIDFFTDVAHEFKTPLSLIIAPLGRLIQGTTDEKDRNALEMVHQNAMKLNSLIHQSIDYYRDNSKVTIGLLLSKVEFVAFAKSIFSSYKESMKNKQIEFIFNTNVEQLFMHIDVVKVESVLNNLLSNAYKFTNPGESIIFSLEYRIEDNGIEIAISDTGIGIPELDIPYVFQRYFQSSANSQKHNGTGIGLFLVKNYVELHGGKVNVTSTMGAGTSFTVWLPQMLSELEANNVDELNIDANSDKPLILIVEDNVAIAELLYNTFISEYRCVTAHNGKTGLNACQKLNPDIIISDVMMPVMDGLEMARQLKENRLTASIPIVLLTAKDDKATELKSIELNIDAFIAKPFDSLMLFSRVKQILENRKALAQQSRIAQITTTQVGKIESLDEKLLLKITKLIEDKIDDPDLNVNMLCELADISSKQIYRKVKQLTGMTTIEYIRSIRMKKAAMYLNNKNFTVAEVMYMVGFSNHSYFAKCFLANFGKSPRQYLEQQKRETEE